MNSLVNNEATRSIGDILVAAGRLSSAETARILQHQQKENIKFGDAAIELKLLTKEHIDFALSQQFDYSYLSAQDTSLNQELVAAYKPFSYVGENLRALRSQLMLRWFNTDPAHKLLSVVSPSSGEGRSFITANLAIVFAQQGARTLVIDGDMRAPRQHLLFKLANNAGLSGILAGRAGMEVVCPIPSLQRLSVLSAGAMPPNPQELLGRTTFANLLQLATKAFDVVIIDTPASSTYADAEIIAARTGAVLVVTRKNHSLLNSALTLTNRLQDNGVTLLGAILNDD